MLCFPALFVMGGGVNRSSLFILYISYYPEYLSSFFGVLYYKGLGVRFDLLLVNGIYLIYFILHTVIRYAFFFMVHYFTFISG